MSGHCPDELTEFHTGSQTTSQWVHLNRTQLVESCVDSCGPFSRSRAAVSSLQGWSWSVLMTLMQ